MKSDPPSECPFLGGKTNASPALEGHNLRWDLAEHAELLIPNPNEEISSLDKSAKEAWRNSVRCIGRRLWAGLNVIDARSLIDPDEIFEALMTHLKKATNGGKIIPVMTVFQEWHLDQPEIRIWNHQLLRYAGYKTPDRKVIGDPMNVELTNLALSLGWRPPAERSRFDLLPIIIQAGEKLRYYELPKHEVFEVQIRHPKHPFLEKMNLRWYAVPVVSDMIFATGSSLYPCAPFSGHYLGTEIGARNLADSNRYNLLPEIATKLGLDMTTPRSLWKDHALVVLNEAVLSSFDNEGVRIADHHGVSDEFLKFCKQEAKAGREARAEWSWIVPPISGSATSVFHRNYKQEAVYPNFLLQVPAWKTERGKEILNAKAPPFL
jgi:nitric-oxide synthase